ncbi:hypothetical protein ABK040_007346 [Willaertia magna]
MKVSSVVNIHLRPDIHLLLANEKTRSLFIEFCKDNFAYETIRCYFAIKEFKKLINASNNNNNKLFNSVTPNDNNNYSTTNTFLINIDNNNNNNTTTTSIDNHNTENNTIIDTNYNNQLNNNKTEEEELKILQKIVELYIEEGSEFEINIDSQTRRKVIFQITNYTNFLTINGLTFKENIFSEVEFQILLILNGDIQQVMKMEPYITNTIINPSLYDLGNGTDVTKSYSARNLLDSDDFNYFVDYFTRSRNITGMSNWNILCQWGCNKLVINNPSLIDAKGMNIIVDLQGKIYFQVFLIME